MTYEMKLAIEEEIGKNIRNYDGEAEAAVKAVGISENDADYAEAVEFAQARINVPSRQLWRVSLAKFEKDGHL